MGGSESTVPYGVGRGRAERAFEHALMEGYDSDGSVTDQILAWKEEEARREWKIIAMYLHRGEGYIPADCPTVTMDLPGKHVRWVRIVNGMEGRRRVIATLYVSYLPAGARRSFWEFPAEVFAVYAHKHTPPNPCDRVKSLNALVVESYGAAHGDWSIFPAMQEMQEYFDSLEPPLHYGTQWGLENGAFVPPGGEVSPYQGSEFDVDSRGSQARGMRPVGVNLVLKPPSPGVPLYAGAYWIFPGGLTVDNRVLAHALSAIRRHGAQEVQVSTLGKVVSGMSLPDYRRI